MTNRERETQARINIQKSLKAAAQSIKAENFSIDRELKKRAPKKTGRTKLCAIISSTIDDFCKGRLVSKDFVLTDSKVSKHKLVRWSYLERNDDHPFEYFENQLFTIGEFFLSTKNPINVCQYDSNIRITRHCLERISERFERDTLAEVFETISVYVSSIGLHKKKCINSIEDNQFILLSDSAYVVVKTKAKKNDDATDLDCEGYEFIITTIIPRSIWSNRRQALLKCATDAIEKYNAKSTEKLELSAIMTIKPSSINNDESNKVVFDEDDFIFLEKA